MMGDINPNQQSERLLMEQLKLQSSVPLVGRSVDRRSGAGCNRVLQEPRRLLDGEVAAKFMSGALDLPQVQKLMSSGGALPVENNYRCLIAGL
jgi:hypothetical protein